MTDISENSLQTSNAPETLPPISKYGKFLDYVWPISRAEAPKFLFITLLMFCILGIQNLIRAMKDSVINTMIGTETISFLKFWGVLPAAFLITIVYVKLVSVMKGENIFYLIMSVFLGFFLLFAFYLFPNHELIHLNPETVNNLVESYPNFKWFILLLSKWSFSLFYIIAELWPNAIFALLFWQFVNKIMCKSCGNESISFDNFMDLSLSFPKNVSSCSVNDMIELFVKKESISDFYCSNCKKHRNCVKEL